MESPPLSADDAGSDRESYADRVRAGSFDNELTSSISSNTQNLPAEFSASSHDDSLDLRDYIPIGCLRLQRSDVLIDREVWTEHCHWVAFAHPQEAYESGLRLPPELQERLLRSVIMKPYLCLHEAAWIRMEFSSHNHDLGSARIYILPDDVGRSKIDREQKSLRKALQHLLASLDISSYVWENGWSYDMPITCVEPSSNEYGQDKTTLFNLFNELPSPHPSPELVDDVYAKDAMYRILENNVDGMQTKMHAFQTRTAAMMLQRESQPTLQLDPRLREVRDQNGSIFYCDTDAGYCLRQPRMYEAARGGICAETMGLGKTLICLALIAATRHIPSKVPDNALTQKAVRRVTGSLMQMAAAAVNRTSTPWRNHFGSAEGHQNHLPVCVKALKDNPGFYHLPSVPQRRHSRHHIQEPQRRVYLTTATLVVVPANLIKQWKFEIKKHADDLSYYASNPKEALPCAAELSRYDIILLSKPCFEKEARDGMDSQGRRKASPRLGCRCAYKGSTRVRECSCFDEKHVHQSPLKDLLFKRIITDEGHTFGNASRAAKTVAMTVIDFLQVGARWVISGTPTSGLHGNEAATSESASSPSPLNSDSYDLPEAIPLGWKVNNNLKDQEQQQLMYEQERKDLEKLGNIATTYLKMQPWVNLFDSGDQASWSQLVMQPRHGRKSHGNMKCLKATMESMIVRHQSEDVRAEVVLPPLHYKVVYLDGSMGDKMSLNLFAMMIVSNAVTSERKDADYLFHHRQRAALQSLFSNLRQASFFWSGYSPSDVRATMEISRGFLQKKEVLVSPEDVRLLSQAIEIGKAVLSNKLFNSASRYHEIPVYVKLRGYGREVRRAWSLDEDYMKASLMGITTIFEMQKFVDSNPELQDPRDELVSVGKEVLGAFKASHDAQSEIRSPWKRKRDAIAVGAVPVAHLSVPHLVGGGKTRSATAPKKHVASRTKNIRANFERPNQEGDSSHKRFKRKLLDSTIVSTASSKLSYLLDQIMAHQVCEKTLIFYEAENVAYYIAQALEILQVPYLIYAKPLSVERRSTYVVTFNQSEKFRVLLMDVSQAAFGLDLSCASRIFFINPVFSPQIEMQAMKRAHRIGQTKPVFVETLVLKGSIEEEILERRKEMTAEEHKACKTVLDDRKMYEWVRNVRFVRMDEQDEPSHAQVTKLAIPQKMFGRGAQIISDPNADLIMEKASPDQRSKERLVRLKTKDITRVDDTHALPAGSSPRGYHKTSALSRMSSHVLDSDLILAVNGGPNPRTLLGNDTEGIASDLSDGSGAKAISSGHLGNHTPTSLNYRPLVSATVVQSSPIAPNSKDPSLFLEARTSSQPGPLSASDTLQLASFDDDVFVDGIPPQDQASAEQRTSDSLASLARASKRVRFG